MSGNKNSKPAVAILVGGGPAPGINGVISAATIEAINRGHRVLGIKQGFEHLVNGDSSNVVELGISDVSRIHKTGGSVLFTSRANPTKSPEMLSRTISVLQELGVGYLVTIGGDDTASSAWAVAKAAEGKLSVAHVPKTIDNDLPLPEMASTFGFQSAREVGTEIVETLMEDAKSTGRWYLVVAMGRKAGHLALGIGIASGATLTVIPEEFKDRNAPMSYLVDTIVGSMLKRLNSGRTYGVAVLAEGLAEVLNLDSLPEINNVERDPHGHIRFSELNFGGILKSAVRARLSQLGLNIRVLDKNVGYELRCHPPITFDREYTRELGYGVVDFLLNGGSNAVITRQGDGLKPLYFEDLIDPEKKRSRIRGVELESSTYSVARQYMIRLQEDDLNNKDYMNQLSRFTSLSSSDLKLEFSRSLSI